jgi:hypothetical protein
MSIEVARNSAYAHLGEAWLRYQSARILKRHLQYGQHCRLDLETLLAAAAGTIASRNLNNRVSNERFDKQPSTLSTSVRVSKLAINGNLLGPPGFDLDQRSNVLAADAQQLTSTARDEVSRDRD